MICSNDMCFKIANHLELIHSLKIGKEMNEQRNTPKNVSNEWTLNSFMSFFFLEFFREYAIIVCVCKREPKKLSVEVNAFAYVNKNKL